MFDVFELQKTLTEHACPSGSEHLKIAPKLAELARPFADEVRIDALGNVICHKKGTGGGKKIMYAAHMDAIGFMVTFIDEKGFLRFDAIGGFAPIRLVNTRVRFLSGARGIIKVRKAPKTLEKPMSALKISDLYIDIGARDQAEAEAVAAVGDIAVFEGQTVRLAGDRIMTPYADDLAACVTLLGAMEQVGPCKNDLWFVFSAQEEVGCRGAKTAAYGIEPDLGFACDVCSVGDTPQSDDVPMAVKVGGGPTIKIKDASVLCSPQLNETLKTLAKQAGITWQDEIMTFGGTDTCAIQMARQGAPATCVSIPTRNIHSPCEIFSAEDVRQAARLLAASAHGAY